MPFFNGIIALCYLGISWNILKGLRDTKQMRTNSLALSTAGIFFTCAVHHGSHTLHMLLPVRRDRRKEGRDMRRSPSTPAWCSGTSSAPASPSTT